MAIAFARVSIHTRAKGHSAVAAVAYRSASKLYDERTGISHDFINRQGVVYTAILLPEGCNKKFENRDFLWNQAELVEKRRDAQVCKDIVLALPKELNLTQQIELAKRFAQVHFVDNGLPADIAIHDHGNGNPHAHILITTRRLRKNGFSKYKARDLNPVFAKGIVVENDYWGSRWREMQEEFFLEKNLDLTVDLNHLISERHHGKVNNQNNFYLQDENILIQQARIEVALESVNDILNHLSSHFSVWTKRDIEKLLFKTFKNSQKPEEYIQLVTKVLAHKEVIHLGTNDRGKLCYTTRDQYIQEARLRRDIEKMQQRYHHTFADNTNNLARDYALTDEQQTTLTYITQSTDLSVVVGRPGTGKSYLLKPVKEYYDANQCSVLGVALSGKVAKSLQADTGIESSTIASLVYRLTTNKLQLTDRHIIIVDEAGMVDFNNMALLIHEACKAGSKIVLVGDPDQLKPIHKGEIFKAITAITGYVELENIKRQHDLGDRKASLYLAQGDIDSALQHYYKKDAIALYDTPCESIDNLINDWQKNITPSTMKDSILLAFTRAAVTNLNLQAREVLQEKNYLGQENIEYQGFDKKLQISIGERLLFRKNDKNLNIRNGDLGTVRAINKEQIQVELDSGEIFNIPKTYQSIEYGYALTVHKSQGMTTENVSVLIDSKYWDRHLSFVAMTRHKQSLKIYADTINHPTLNDLKRTMSRSVTKDNVIDWPLNFAIQMGFDPDKLIGKVVNHLAGIGHKIRDGFNYIVNYEAHLLNTREKLALNAAKQTAKNLDNQYQERAYHILKTKYPVFAEYDALINQSQYLTGFNRDKIDKKIQNMVEKIQSDKKLRKTITLLSPKIAERIIAGEKKREIVVEK